jgi:NDP-sugar pyrophosphorylase family protein
MLNIVVPIAGRGSRFLDAGYDVPKPLLPVHGVPMIEVVVNNVRPRSPHRFIFVALQAHLDRSGVRDTLGRIAPSCAIVPVREVTRGAACSVLLARDLIDNSDPLMIANSDQWVDLDINDYLSELEHRGADGLIMTMRADHPKWSYVGLGPDGWVERVVEKQVISAEATVGIYNFRHGAAFVRAADGMIAADLRVNGEFYVAPVYNELIKDGAKVCVHNVGGDGSGMYGLGVPEDLESFLAKPLSRRAATRRA